jgi:hypothetical protein
MAEQNPDSTTTGKVVIEREDKPDVVIDQPVGLDMMGSVKDPGGTNMEARHHISEANDTSGKQEGVVTVKDEPQGDAEVFPGTGGDSAPSAAPDPEDNAATDFIGEREGTRHSRSHGPETVGEGEEGYRPQPEKADVELDTEGNDDRTADEQTEEEEPRDFTGEGLSQENQTSQPDDVAGEERVISDEGAVAPGPVEEPFDTAFPAPEDTEGE